jgi:hypothetical protein
MMRILKMLGKGLSTLVVFFALVFSFAGCLNESPLASTDESLAERSKFKIVPLWKGIPTLAKQVAVSENVTIADGGELLLEYKGEEHKNPGVYCKVSLKIFAGTIDADKKLTMSLDDQYLDLLFGPHGVVFSEPALLNIEAAVDLSIGRWEKMSSTHVVVDKDAGYIKIIDAQIPHFSRYAIGYDE